MCSCKQLNLMLLISKWKLYLLLFVMEQWQCMIPDESVRRRTEVLSCDWVHKFTLESVLRRTEVLFCDWVHKFTLESVLRRTEVLFCDWVHKFTLESACRRTEVLSCGWVHKFALESGGRSEDSINLLTLDGPSAGGGNVPYKIVYYCRCGPSV